MDVCNVRPDRFFSFHNASTWLKLWLPRHAFQTYPLQRYLSWIYTLQATKLKSQATFSYSGSFVLEILVDFYNYHLGLLPFLFLYLKFPFLYFKFNKNEQACKTPPSTLLKAETQSRFSLCVCPRYVWAPGTPGMLCNF